MRRSVTYFLPLVALQLAGSALFAFQVPQSLNTPKLPSFGAKPKPAAPKAPVLKHLILASELETAAKLPVAGNGQAFLTLGALSIFERPDFKTRMEQFLGKELSMDLVQTITKEMIAYAQEHDQVSLRVELPDQDPSSGVLRLRVKMSTVHAIEVVGNEWISDANIASRFGLEVGEDLTVSKLDAAINWVNADPFLKTQVVLKLSPEDSSQVNVFIAAKDRIPIKAAISYDNSGTAILGQHVYAASFAAGNLLGTNHLWSYEYKTSNAFDSYQSHSTAYKIPLPWRHYFQVQGAMASVNAFFNQGFFKHQAKNYVMRASYLAPVKTKWGTVDFSLSADYKQSNSDLLYRSFLDNSLTPLASQQKAYDTAQINAGASTIFRDKLGATLIGFNVNISPGRFNSRNVDVKEDEAAGREWWLRSRYAYGSLNLQRLFKLPGGMEFVTLGTFQATTRNLRGSEQMSIGGSTTVRGYDERIYSGDQGMVINTEIHGPVWRTSGTVVNKFRFPIANQLIAFLDYGRVSYKDPKPSDVRHPNLVSAGLGLRSNIANSLSLSADYGWMIKTLHYAQNATAPNSGRASIKATMSF